MVNNAGHQQSSDEIDLRQLLQTLWASKIQIVLVTLLATLIAITYAFSATPAYQTVARTLPPTAGDLASYNMASQLTGNAIRGAVADLAPGIDALTPAQAYNVFLRYLNSNLIRQDFFEQYYLPAQNDKSTEGDKQRAWKRLDGDLTIVLPRKADEYEASVTFEGYDPGAIAKWANSYVRLAMEAANEDLLSGLAGEVKIRKQSLEEQIATLRNVAETTREDQLIRLKDALNIAESIGLESPTDGGPLIAINTNNRENDQVNSGNLLYLRGSRALQAEILRLEERASNDPYIYELPDLLKKRDLLNTINLDPDLLTVAIIDRAAVIPEEPIKPRKILILFSGTMIGFLFAIFIALLRQYLKN